MEKNDTSNKKNDAFKEQWMENQIDEYLLTPSKIILYHLNSGCGCIKLATKRVYLFHNKYWNIKNF